jgi:hypothetical protein
MKGLGKWVIPVILIPEGCILPAIPVLKGIYPSGTNTASEPVHVFPDRERIEG